MALNCKRTRALPVLEIGLLVAVFSVPLSLSVSEGLLYCLCLPLWAILMVHRRDARFVRCPFFWPMLIFFSWAILTSIWGVRPGESLLKCRRLTFLGIVFVVAAVYDPSDPSKVKYLWRPVLVFVGACVLRSIYDMWRLTQVISVGYDPLVWGDMRAPQYYLVALCFLVSALSYRAWRRWWVVWGLASILSLYGLVSHFKRGPWVGFVVAMLLIGLLMRRYKLLLALGVAGLALLALPVVQTRLKQVTWELTPERGGRYLLWTQSAPQLFREHPFGMGYYGTTYEDLIRTAPEMRDQLTHLHSNFLQILVETSIPGLIVWCFWMGQVVWVLARTPRGQGVPDSMVWLNVGALGTTVGLLVVGIAEYNFGSSQILILFSLLMGMAWVLDERARITGDKNHGCVRNHSMNS